MILITDQYQETYWPMRFSCNVMINLKWDGLMTWIGLVCKRSEYLMNLKEDKVICRNVGRVNPMILKSHWADSNYIKWERMMLINDQHQNNDFSMRVACENYFLISNLIIWWQEFDKIAKKCVFDAPTKYNVVCWNIDRVNPMILRLLLVKSK